MAVCILSHFEGTANLHCYTSCTLSTLIVAKCNFFSVVTWKKYLQKCEGCTHFCEILSVYIYIAHFSKKIIYFLKGQDCTNETWIYFRAVNVVMSKNVFNVFCNCVYVLDVVLFAFFLFFSLFSSSSEDRNSNQLCSIGDACGDWMMTGGRGHISGGSVEETYFCQGHSSSWLDLFMVLFWLI